MLSLCHHKSLINKPTTSITNLKTIFVKPNKSSVSASSHNFMPSTLESGRKNPQFRRWYLTLYHPRLRQTIAVLARPSRDQHVGGHTLPASRHDSDETLQLPHWTHLKKRSQEQLCMLKFIRNLSKMKPPVNVSFYVLFSRLIYREETRN